MENPSVTYLRLTPRTKFLVHLISRTSGVSFAELLETVLTEYLDFATVIEDGIEIRIAELSSTLWSDHPADRIALVGNRFPQALRERERVLWERIICESPRYWKVPLTHKPQVVDETTFEFAKFRDELSLFDGFTRDEMIVHANALQRQRANAATWSKQIHPND